MILKQLNKEIELEVFLKRYKITITLDEIIDLHNTEERFYHTFDHVIELLNDITINDDALIMAIIFHDIKYCSRSEAHEEESAEFFDQVCEYENVFKLKVKNLILATQYIKESDDPIEREIIRVDRSILYKKDINSLLTWENSIFKEFQHLSVNEYKKGRATFLNYAYEETGNLTLLELRDIVVEKVYKIGFYPGSFNPFHIGHYNILKKAEKSFDKVVIGVGVNYEKRNIEKEDFPKKIQNREIVMYDGLITTEILRLQEEGDVFVVRGLRNAYDLQHEEALRNVIKDFLHDLEFVYYFCDKEYEHISSSVIRDIRSRGKTDMVMKMLDEYTVK